MRTSKRTQFVVLPIGMFLLFACSVTYIYFDVPLRTAIFRSFAKGSWYITSDADTLFTFGYYGVRKYVHIVPNGLKLIAENDEFCTNTNIARGGCIYKDYLYVSVRSYLGGQQEKNDAGYINGMLLILKRKDLCLIKKIPYDIKLIEVKIHGCNLLVSGLGGFDLYDISVPETPVLCFRYRHSSWKEFHGFDFFETNGRTYIAFALFTGGIEIWDMTNPTQLFLRATVSFSTPTTDGTILSAKLQTLHVLADYPYLYAPFGPSRAVFNNEDDKRGILTYDVSDLNNIKVNATLIPSADWYSESTGDLAPSFIERHQSTIYTNFGEKGVAVFDITRSFTPKYVKTQDVSKCNALIQPIHITSTGWLYSGNYYWNDIYSYKLTK